MSACFEPAIQHVLAQEGGLSTDWRDHGGTTKYGISKAQYPALDIQALTLDDAKAIYQRDYWQPIWNGLASQDLATALLDMAVNAGPQQAVLLVQRAIGDCGMRCTVDGLFGQSTLAACNQLEVEQPGQLLTAYRARRIQHYALLAIHDTTQQPFLFGWIRRALA